MSLKEHEQALERELTGKGKTAPRVTSDHVDACIVGRSFHRIPDTLATVCVLALYNGWVIHGINPGPVSADNFDPEIGERLAFENARNQIWALEGYLLRDRLHRAEGGAPVPCYGGVVDDVVEELEAARAVLYRSGYGYVPYERRWLRGDEGLLLGMPPAFGTDSPAEDLTTLNDAQRVEAVRRIKAELDAPAPSGVFAVETGGAAPPVHVDGEGSVIPGGRVATPEEEARAFGDVERHTAVTDRTIFGADYGNKPDETVTAEVHPDGEPVRTITDEQQAAITEADGEAAKFHSVGRNAAGELGELSSAYPLTNDETARKLYRVEDGAIIDVPDATNEAAPSAAEPQG